MSLFPILKKNFVKYQLTFHFQFLNNTPVWRDLNWLLTSNDHLFKVTFKAALTIHEKRSLINFTSAFDENQMLLQNIY
jgi:hypothetical protein